MELADVLGRDHARIDELLSRLEGAPRTELRSLVDRLVRELSVHAAVEEQLVYPELRRRIGRLEPDALYALEQHHAVKVMLVELGRCKDADRLHARARVLADLVRRHIEQEEAMLLPDLERALSPEEVRRMAMAVSEAKPLAPTRPHPNAPDEPPANVVASLVAKGVDTARDLLRTTLRHLPRPLRSS